MGLKVYMVYVVFWALDSIFSRSYASKLFFWYDMFSVLFSFSRSRNFNWSRLCFSREWMHVPTEIFKTWVRTKSRLRHSKFLNGFIYTCDSCILIQITTIKQMMKVLLILFWGIIELNNAKIIRKNQIALTYFFAVKKKF